MAVADQLLNFTQTLSVQKGILALQPMVLFVITMVLYSIFVYSFYKFISRRDIFRISSGAHSGARRVLVGLEYIFLFPVIAFVWFFVIAVLLSMLSEVITIGNVFLVSMSTLITIRLTAHYHEDLSRDIAKLIPFTLLAVFLLDISKISLAVSFTIWQQIPDVMSTLIYYFIFIVILELLLKLTFHRKLSKRTK